MFGMLKVVFSYVLLYSIIIMNIGALIIRIGFSVHYTIF